MQLLQYFRLARTLPISPIPLRWSYHPRTASRHRQRRLLRKYRSRRACPTHHARRATQYGAAGIVAADGCLVVRRFLSFILTAMGRLCLTPTLIQRPSKNRSSTTPVMGLPAHYFTRPEALLIRTTCSACTPLRAAQPRSTKLPPRGELGNGLGEGRGSKNSFRASRNRAQNWILDP